MISLSKVDDVIKFTFEDNGHYLYNGTIEVPVNSLMLVTDESDMFTFKKSASNDIFISGLYSEIGMSKSELESWYKENMVGNTGTKPEEIQEMIDESISGKLETSTFNTYSGNVETELNNKLDATAYTPTDLSNYDTKSEVNQKIAGSLSAKANASDFNSFTTTTNQALSEKQETLVSGTNIKTVNGTSLLGGGNLIIGDGQIDLTIDSELDSGSTNPVANSAITNAIASSMTVADYTPYGCQIVAPNSLGRIDFSNTIRITSWEYSWTKLIIEFIYNYTTKEIWKIDKNDWSATMLYTEYETPFNVHIDQSTHYVYIEPSTSNSNKLRFYFTDKNPETYADVNFDNYTLYRPNEYGGDKYLNKHFKARELQPSSTVSAESLADRVERITNNLSNNMLNELGDTENIPYIDGYSSNIIPVTLYSYDLLTNERCEQKIPVFAYNKQDFTYDDRKGLSFTKSVLDKEKLLKQTPELLVDDFTNEKEYGPMSLNGNFAIILRTNANFAGDWSEIGFQIINADNNSNIGDIRLDYNNGHIQGDLFAGDIMYNFRIEGFTLGDDILIDLRFLFNGSYDAIFKVRNWDGDAPKYVNSINIYGGGQIYNATIEFNDWQKSVDEKLAEYSVKEEVIAKALFELRNEIKNLKNQNNQ